MNGDGKLLVVSRGLRFDIVIETKFQMEISQIVFGCVATSTVVVVQIV